MLAYFISFLSDHGLKEISRITRSFKLPPDVSRIPNIGEYCCVGENSPTIH